MKRMLCCLAVAVLGVAAPLLAQAPDVNKILADARAALGGEKKLSGVKTLAATGQSIRVTGNASAPAADVELAFELPDRFMKKDVLAMTPNGAVTRTSGFNGDAPINVIDQPPASPGMIQLFRFGPGGPGEGPSTPEQQEENRKSMLLSAKQDFARMSLGMMLSPLAAYPLEFCTAARRNRPTARPTSWRSRATAISPRVCSSTAAPTCR